MYFGFCFSFLLYHLQPLPSVFILYKHILTFLTSICYCLQFSRKYSINRNELVVVACFCPLCALNGNSIVFPSDTTITSVTATVTAAAAAHICFLVFGIQFTDKNYWMLKSTYWTKVGLKVSTSTCNTRSLAQSTIYKSQIKYHKTKSLSQI